MKKHPFARRSLALLASSLLFLTACSGGSESSDTTTVQNTLRIVSLSPTATEMLYAIGAGDQVVAVDSLSTFPAEVASKVTKISAYEPSAEAILGYTPDVVLISNDMNKISEQLRSVSAQKIQVWTGAAAASLEDVYSQINELGVLTGRTSAATELVSSMKTRIAKATSSVTAKTAVSYYYELDNTYYSVTSNTFVGALLKPFGMTNIADGVETGNDYPQLNAEAIANANPTVIFLADIKCCAMTKDIAAKRAGWNNIDAVKNGNIVELDDDVASRWGPRVVDLIEQFAMSIALITP